MILIIHSSMRILINPLIILTFSCSAHAGVVSRVCVRVRPDVHLEQTGQRESNMRGRLRRERLTDSGPSC